MFLRLTFSLEVQAFVGMSSTFDTLIAYRSTKILNMGTARSDSSIAQRNRQIFELIAPKEESLPLF